MLLVFGSDQALWSPSIKQAWVEVHVRLSYLEAFGPNMGALYMYVIPW